MFRTQWRKKTNSTSPLPRGLGTGPAVAELLRSQIPVGAHPVLYAVGSSRPEANRSVEKLAHTIGGEPLFATRGTTTGRTLDDIRTVHHRVHILPPLRLPRAPPRPTTNPPPTNRTPELFPAAHGEARNHRETAVTMLIIFAGAFAQLVDGGIGMGFGVTSTTICCSPWGPPKHPRSSTPPEVGTTLASGLSHWRFGNVNWRVVLTLGVPGAIGAATGATLLSHIATDSAKPITAIILALVGVNLLWRFSRGVIARHNTPKPYRTPFLIFLGVFGGLIDATGGGGWGPYHHLHPHVVREGGTAPGGGHGEYGGIFGGVGRNNGVHAGIVAGITDQCGGGAVPTVGRSAYGAAVGVADSPHESHHLGRFVGTALISLNIPQ